MCAVKWDESGAAMVSHTLEKFGFIWIKAAA